MEEVVAAIEAAAPEISGMITFADERLPFPERLQSGLLERLVGPVAQTTLSEGVHRTVDRFRELTKGRTDDSTTEDS